jgi:hypothetical protein
MKKLILKSPTLYKTYKWFLENVSDDLLKARGCDVNTIALIHTIHEEIVNGQSHQNGCFYISRQSGILRN